MNQTQKKIPSFDDLSPQFVAEQIWEKWDEEEIQTLVDVLRDLGAEIEVEN